MTIQILGTGCAKCEKTFRMAEEAVKNCGIDAEIVKVTEIQHIINFGVMMTPALAIDGEVKISGRVPAVEQIEGWIKEAQG